MSLCQSLYGFGDLTTDDLNDKDGIQISIKEYLRKDFFGEESGNVEMMMVVGVSVGSGVGVLVGGGRIISFSFFHVVDGSMLV